MSRTNVFISYSRADREWRSRLVTHLGVLERLGLIEVWSDNRIGAGSKWEEEIQAALTRAKVAVLLLSPSFLASPFIWDKEMPRIIEHEKAGMIVLPLIARPCAWRLEPDLEPLEARPFSGQALSVGSDSDADLDLTAFAYELHAIVKPESAPLADAERERAEELRAGGRSTGGRKARSMVIAAKRRRPARSALETGRWIGYYNNPDRPIRLSIRKIDGNEFHGTIEYLGEGTITKAEGTFGDVPRTDPLFAQLPGTHRSDARLGLSFHETGYEKEGIRPIDMKGEYRAAIAGATLTGAWFGANRRLVGLFKLTRE